MRVIAGSAKSIQLKTAPGMDTRPTTDRTKETLFNMIQPYLCDSRVLDLFSGSGALGIESLSRGADLAVFVEKDPRALQCIRENLQNARLADKADVRRDDVLNAISRMGGEAPFDLIFMDPPYNQNLEEQVLRALQDMSLVGVDTLLVVEASLETGFSYLESYGYEIRKRKDYKTNSHILIQKIQNSV